MGREGERRRALSAPRPAAIAQAPRRCYQTAMLGRRSLRWTLVGAASLWLVSLLVSRSGSLAGDPYAVYFPIAQNLSAGHLLSGFGPLGVGIGRLPGFPILLTLAGGLTSDLVRAAQLANLLAAGVILVVGTRLVEQERLHPLVTAAVVLPVVANYEFARSVLESLPDMTYLGLYVGAIALLTKEATAPSVRTSFDAGLVAGLGASIRLNGVAMLGAGVAAIVWSARTNAVRRGAAFAAGFLLGALPIAWASFGLAQAGIRYPRNEAHRLVDGAQGTWTAWASLVSSGAAEVFPRLRSLMTSTVAGLGLWGLAYGAFVLRRPVARVTLVATVAMLAMLLPLHYEGRYYLFALAPLWAAAVAFLLGLAQRLDQKPWVGALVALILIVSQAGEKATRSWKENVREEAVDRQFQAGCAALKGPAGAPRIVGITPDRYAYSRFLGCVRPEVEYPELLLVPTTSSAVGLDYFLFWDGQHFAPPFTEVTRAAAFVFGRAPARAPTEGARRALPHPALSVTTPTLGGCPSAELALPPGTHAVEVAVQTHAPLVARVLLTSGGAEREGLLAGPGRVALPVSPGSAQATLRLCPADPLRYPGTIRLTGVEAVTAIQPAAEGLPE